MKPVYHQVQRVCAEIRQVTKPKGQEPDTHRKTDEQQRQKRNGNSQNISENSTMLFVKLQ